MSGKKISMSGKKMNEKVCNGFCKISRLDKTIVKCFKCEVVVHMKCAGLSTIEYEALICNDQNGLVFLCRTCKIALKSDDNDPESQRFDEIKLNDLKIQINKLSTNINLKLTEIEKKIETNSPSPNMESENNLTDKLGKIEQSLCNKVDNVGNKIITSYAQKVSQNIQENNDQTKVITEINKQFDGLKNDLVSKLEEDNKTKIEQKLIDARKNNICIFNLPESQQNDPKLAYQEDINSIKLLFANRVELQKQDIIEVYRKGNKNNGSARRIIIKFSSYEKKIEILKLRNLHFKTDSDDVVINIVHDRTITQQIQHKKLVKELKERREKGESDIYIKNGKIIQYKQPFRPAPQDFWGN